MTFYKIPEKFMGEDGKTNYERVMRGENKKTEEQTPIAQPTKKDLADFIYVPSINLYVAKQRTHFGKNWFDCHKELQKNNERMLIIPEFIEFLKYTKINFPDIYKDITEVRNPWRAEWLDADFKVINEKLHVNYNHILDKNGNLTPKNSELLNSNTLMQDKTPRINLENYLNNFHTHQGLPNKNVGPGDLYYWYPRSDNNLVARFFADSDRAVLGCYRYPSAAGSSLGVRRCKAGLAGGIK